VVKHIAVHASPKAFLKYILNGDKNSEMKYATGINSVVDVEQSYEMLEENFERNTGEKFFKYTVEKENGNVKEKIRLHHYIQSFSPDEKISPEEAHRIGLEWAKKTFGSNRQIICSTHIDRHHIHNHFAVAVYDDSGTRWVSNKKTLTAARKISDDISLKHGISIIDNANKRGGVKYKEWIEKNGGSSWKEKLRHDIDKLVADENVSGIDEMMKRLSDDGYHVRNGKFISIRAPEHDRGIRIFRLGNGYSEDDIKYRLQNRDKEYSVPAIMQKYKGIQIEYALCLRLVQIIVYHKQANPKKYSVRNVQDMGNVLTHMYQQGIFSRSDFNDRINKDRERYERAKAELERLEKQIASVQKIADDCAVFSAINKKSLTLPKRTVRNIVGQLTAGNMILMIFQDSFLNLCRNKTLSQRNMNQQNSSFHSQKKQQASMTVICLMIFQKLSNRFGQNGRRRLKLNSSDRKCSKHSRRKIIQ